MTTHRNDAKWTLSHVGQYDDGSPSFALIDPRGTERMVGPIEDFEALAGEFGELAPLVVAVDARLAKEPA